MCNHCRAIVLGAFVVGALAGALTGSLVLDKKYKEAYAREVEAARAAAKRVIKSLRDKLEEKSRVTVSEEDEKEMDEAAELEGQQAFDDYLDHVRKNYINDEFAQKAHGETPKTDNETPISRNVAYPEDEDTIDYRYIPSMNKWYSGDGDPLEEKTVADILSEEGLRDAYQSAADGASAVQIRGYLVVFKGLDE